MQKQVLYVTHQGAKIHRSNGMVGVTIDQDRVERIPADTLDRILVFGNVQVTTQVIALLLRHGVGLSFLSSSGRFRGQLISPESGNVFVRLAQHERFHDAPFRARFARDLIAEKLREARALLNRHARNHKDTADDIRTAVRELRELARRLDPVPDPETLRGFEGAAAAAYFRVFGRMVRGPFVFEGRSRRPARDSVNALLNLGYTLVGQEVADRLETVGLDPRIGFFHGVRYGRRSLALDLIEPHRVRIVDRTTLSLLNRRSFLPDDFQDQGGRLGVRLKPDGFRRYLASFETAMNEPGLDGMSPRDRIQTQVTRVRAMLVDPRLLETPA